MPHDQNWNPRAATRRLVDAAVGIISEYAALGYRLTLRQVFYQLVARDMIENTQKRYKSLGSALTRARWAGMLDMDAMDDVGRTATEWGTFAGPREALRRAARGYTVDRWADHPRVEVWAEKDAARSILLPVARRYQCAYQSTRGYASLSALAAAADRNLDEDWTIILVTDHDPSGLDLARALTETLDELAGWRCTVERVAITREQIDQYAPPPNLTKPADSRAEWYNREHGPHSWELDALAPDVLDRIVSDAVDALLPDDWADRLAAEAADRKRIWALADTWAA